MLRGETDSIPAQPSKGKPQYKTAQDELREARLRQEAAADAEADEPAEAEKDEADPRQQDGIGETSDKDDDAGRVSKHTH